MMKKFILIITLFLSSIIITKALPLPVEVTADAVVLMNEKTGQVIYEKNPDKKEILASLTKMMTAYTVIRNVDNLNETITITEQDIYNLWGYTTTGLELGDKVTYLDLLYGTILRSGADAAQALAYHTSGSVEEFVSLMNKEANILGMRNTIFTDVYGGDAGNVSTARELALFLREALKESTFKKVFGTNVYMMSNGKETSNATASLAEFHGLDSNLLTGNKSGFTQPAGLLLASTATINDIDYILIVCKSKINQWYTTSILETYQIYDYIKELNFQEETLIPKGTLLKKIKVEEGTTSEYVVTTTKDIIATLTPEEINKVSYDYNIADTITKDNKLGDNLGYIDVLVNGEVIYTYNIYLTDSIFSYTEESHVMILVIIIIAFFIIVLFCINLFNSKKLK